MSTVAEVGEACAAVWEMAEGLGREVGFTQRRSKLSAAQFVVSVVLGWLERPSASLTRLTQRVASLGCVISSQGLDQRFGPAAIALLQGTLERAVGRLLRADRVAIPVLARFTAVIIGDCTTIGLPDALAACWRGTGERTGHNQAALKFYVRLDLLGGGLDGPYLHDGRTADKTALAQAPPFPVGSLVIHDLGFFALGAVRAMTAVGVSWLSRLQAQVAVFDQQGRRLDLVRLFRQRARAGLDLPVQLGVAERLPARLLAVPVPPDVAAKRRAALRAEARHKGQPVSQTRLALADWTILVTNGSADQLALDEALILYRARWQIELLFKLWKQDGGLARSRSQKPDRILAEVFAKALAVLLQHWLLLRSCWELPTRSLVKAAAAIRANVALLAAAYRGCLSWEAALTQLQSALGPTCRLASRRKKPSTAHLLLRCHPPAPLRVPA